MFGASRWLEPLATIGASIGRLAAHSALTRAVVRIFMNASPRGKGWRLVVEPSGALIRVVVAHGCNERRADSELHPICSPHSRGSQPHDFFFRSSGPERRRTAIVGVFLHPRIAFTSYCVTSSGGCHAFTSIRSYCRSVDCSGARRLFQQ